MTAEIDHNSINPLYKQLKKILQEAVNTRKFRAGQQIPSESNLAITYNLSRITVRNAISELVKEGVLIRRQGKGTYVSGATIKPNFEKIIGYSESMQRRGYNPSRKLIRRGLIDKYPNYIRDILKVKNGEKVIYIRRLLLADDEPMLMEDSYYPENYTFLLKADLDSISTYSLFKSNLDLLPYKAIRTISVGFADQETIEYLLIKKNEPLLSIHEKVYDYLDSPIHYSVSLAVSRKTSIQIIAYASNSEDYKVIPFSNK